jgi:hypothetical protein
VHTRRWVGNLGGVEYLLKALVTLVGLGNVHDGKCPVAGWAG